jgi:hypothetical protein
MFLSATFIEIRLWFVGFSLGWANGTWLAVDKVIKDDLGEWYALKATQLRNCFLVSVCVIFTASSRLCQSNPNTICPCPEDAKPLMEQTLSKLQMLFF